MRSFYKLPFILWSFFYLNSYKYYRFYKQYIIFFLKAPYSKIKKEKRQQLFRKMRFYYKEFFLLYQFSGKIPLNTNLKELFFVKDSKYA